jgi:hypothetical protein
MSLVYDAFDSSIKGALTSGTGDVYVRLKNCVVHTKFAEYGGGRLSAACDRK